MAPIQEHRPPAPWAGVAGAGTVGVNGHLLHDAFSRSSAFFFFRRARGWKKRGWVKSDKKPALNPDLWEQLLALTDRHQLRYHWVKGHAENPYNNRCDEMAVAESRKFKA